MPSRYRVFPDFLRQREQRIGGFVTLPQMGVGMGGMMALIVAAKASLWLVVPCVLLTALGMYAAAPIEGELRAVRWLMPLRMLLNRERLTHFHAFPTSRLGGEPDVVPLVVYGDDGAAMLTAEVLPDELGGL